MNGAIEYVYRNDLRDDRTQIRVQLISNTIRTIADSGDEHRPESFRVVLEARDRLSPSSRPRRRPFPPRRRTLPSPAFSTLFPRLEARLDALNAFEQVLWRDELRQFHAQGSERPSPGAQVRSRRPAAGVTLALLARLGFDPSAVFVNGQRSAQARCLQSQLPSRRVTASPASPACENAVTRTSYGRGSSSSGCSTDPSRPVTGKL